MIEPAPEHPTQPTATAAFDDLFKIGFTRVVRTLVLMGARLSVAEEHAQEAFFIAYTRWDEVRSKSSPIAWVARTAINKWVQDCRTDDRRHGLLERAGLLRLTKESNDPGDVDERLDTQRLLQQLPERQREVMVLHYILDQSVRDIARTLEVAEGTVKSQLYDARHSLASKAQTEDNQGGDTSERERK
jgi:RNA polymerase sigma-70 factor, ECF subfamily